VPSPSLRRGLRALGATLGTIVGLVVVVLAIVIVHGLVIGAQSFEAQRAHLATRSAEPVPGWVDESVEPGTREDARFDELQFTGSHNSYATEPTWLQLAVIELADGSGDTLRYSHADLSTQLDAGIRAIELDVRDHGDRFSNTHVPLLANAGTAPDFALALEELRMWSDAHPGHAPIVVQLELKDDYAFLDLTTRAWNADGFARLDAVIAERLGGRVFAPADLQAAGEWPTLGELRGRFVLYFDSSDVARETLGFGSAEVFVSGPDAAFVVLNDPADPAIPAAVAAGQIVRTRADADLRVDPAERDAAIASGATIVSTDFPPSEPGPDGYAVEFGGGHLVRER